MRKNYTCFAKHSLLVSFLRLCFAGFLSGLLSSPAIALNDSTHSSGNLKPDTKKSLLTEESAPTARSLFFSPTSLSYTVVQNGTAPTQSARVYPSRGNVSVVRLTKSNNSSWLILPSTFFGSYVYITRALSFGVKASGLSPGTYTAYVTAAASGYTSATLKVTLKVTAVRTLSFSPANLTYSVVQNGTTAKQSSILSANSGTPAIGLSKSVNTNWLLLPSAGLGNLSFGINATGLKPGTYISYVVASANGYASSTLKVTLNVTIAQTLSFSPTSLAYSVLQNGTTANKSSVLAASTGTPAVSLSKPGNTNWLVLPAGKTGTLSFGINATGLAPGNYSALVTASASGFTPATLQVTLAVTLAQTLSFSPASLTYSVVQNGATANKSSVLTASAGTPQVALSKSANSNWLVLPAAQPGTLSFGINSTGLAPGNYSAVVTASSGGYTSAVCNIYLEVLSVQLSNFKVNFQDSVTVPPGGWLKDFGQSFNARTSPNQGTGYKFGWLKKADHTPLDLTKNGRKRSTPSDILLATFMHMQGNDIASFSGTPIEGIWEAEVVNGKYYVTVAVGEDTQIDSKHSINVEGVSAIAAFIPTSGVKFKSATVLITVSDGKITVDANGGTNTKINWLIIEPAKPAVVSVAPPDNSAGVNVYSSISTNLLRLPFSGINNATINSSSVYLTENATGTVVNANVNGTGGGDGITLVPVSALKLNTPYKLYITSGVKDLSGNSFTPYTSTFTTATSSVPEVIAAQFEKINLPTAEGRHSSLTIGPDGKLYALTIDGIIKRFTINSDGTLSSPQLIYSLQDAYGARKSRLAIGFTFSPSATATNLVAWITHCTYTFLNAPDWDGKLTKVSGANLENVQDVLINLPRSAKDHVSNSVAFGPDGALYMAQGSTSAMGMADQTWNNRDEHLLSAAILRLDLAKLSTLPLDVKTAEGGGTYNPYAASAPLTIYASGVRNAYDIVWHSNGSLYAPTNGSAAGGNTPASVNGTLRPNGSAYNGPVIPSLLNVQQTQYDYLFRVVQGGYYGHPNPKRGEYVMNGGNPTSSADAAEVVGYPVGTLPDVNWRGSAFDFKNNASPDGAIEYKSNAFNGALKGKLLVVRYSQHDDIITLTPGASKDIVSFTEGKSITGFSGFIDPLDLTEDVRNGNLYVSEYGGDTGMIVLLRPTAAATLARTAARSSGSRNLATVSSLTANTVPGCDEGVPVAIGGIQPTNIILSNTEKARVSPNPVRKKFNIQFPGKYKGDYALQIINPLGATYDVGKVNVNEGGTIKEINISKFSLVTGVYFLRITSENNKAEVLKLIVE